jgi:putative transposase
VAIAVRETGDREIVGLSLGASEEYASWLDLLQSLVRRGLKGVELFTSDAHEGLKAAVEQALHGATRQRCRVHLMRNGLVHTPKGSKSVVAAAQRTIFAQPDQQAARQQLGEVFQAMRERWPKAAEVLAGAEDDVLAYICFPAEHWTRLYSTSPLERLNKEIKRRTNVVGVLPDEASVTRLVGAVLMEISDEWQVGRHCFSRESIERLPQPDAILVAEPQPLRLAPVH